MIYTEQIRRVKNAWRHIMAQPQDFNVAKVELDKANIKDDQAESEEDCIVELMAWAAYVYMKDLYNIKPKRAALSIMLDAQAFREQFGLTNVFGIVKQIIDFLDKEEKQ